MDEKILEFHRYGSGYEWTAIEGYVKLCSGGVEENLYIPSNVTHIQLVVTTDRPEAAGKHAFRIIGGTVDFPYKMRLYDEAEQLLRRFYREGYRFIHVRYKARG